MRLEKGEVVAVAGDAQERAAEAGADRGPLAGHQTIVPSPGTPPARPGPGRPRPEAASRRRGRAEEKTLAAGHAEADA
jgi:hypothetical protein